jgi:hypothetical protein
MYIRMYENKEKYVTEQFIILVFADDLLCRKTTITGSRSEIMISPKIVLFLTIKILAY